MTVEKAPKRKTIRTKSKSSSKAAADSAPPIDRQLIIEREAYLRAERRGFEPGHELEDWLAAEHFVGSRADA